MGTFCNFLVTVLCDFGSKNSGSSPSPAPLTQRARWHTYLNQFLNVLTFNTSLTVHLWKFLEEAVDLDEFVMANSLNKSLQVR